MLKTIMKYWRLNLVLMVNKATQESVIQRIVDENKEKYATFNGFYNECKKHMCISDVEVFKIVYWENKSLSKYRKKGVIVTKGVAPGETN